MSYAVDVTVEVRGYRPERERAICDALDRLMDEHGHGFDPSEPAIGGVGDQAPFIRVFTRLPIIIGGIPRENEPPWEEGFTRQTLDTVAAANGRPCEVDVRLRHRA